MTLKDMISADVAGVFLNTDEFAESVVFKPETPDSTSVDVALFFGEVVEDIRRATVTLSTSTTVAVGDEWKQSSGTWWVTQYVDLAEFGMQTATLFERPPTRALIKSPTWTKTSVGSQEKTDTATDRVWAKFVLQDGTADGDNRRRDLQPFYHVYLDRSVDVSDDHIIEEEFSGTQYRIVGYESPEEVDRMFRLFCEPI